jgi:hypothetical protein
MFSNSGSPKIPLVLLKDSAKANILFSFEGVVEHRTIDYLLNTAVDELDEHAISKPVQKKAFRIMMECLENIQKHSGNGQSSHSFSKFLVLKNNSHLIFYTSNSVLNSNIEDIKKRIDEINQSGIEKLKSMQEETLINGKLSDRGGSGIGLINIAIRSNNKFEYVFENIDHETSRFTLQIRIKI